jgi:hypothetical protein
LVRPDAVRPFPCSTRISIRLLSMSETLSDVISEARKPAAYATLKASLVLEARGRIEEALDFLRAQDDRQLPGLRHKENPDFPLEVPRPVFPLEGSTSWITVEKEFGHPLCSQEVEHSHHGRELGRPAGRLSGCRDERA